MDTISDAERRRRLQVRHHLTVSHRALGAVDAAEGVFALHATDPATVYLSVLARAPRTSLRDVATALYDERSLMRLMGMRRTLFVAPMPLAPLVHHGASLAVADRLRRGLVKDLRTLPTEPEIPGDADAWLAEVEASTMELLESRGVATAAALSADEPRLRTALLPVTDKPWDVRRTLTSRILTLMGAEGRIVRGRPRGDWTSRAHTWEPARTWWPDGVPRMSEAEARADLAHRWLAAYGPATLTDLQWWTGWSQSVTRTAVAPLDTVDVRLDAADGIVLADDTEPTEQPTPSADLLPALDPTPMGWKRRDWYVGDHAPRLFDRFGNIGPTVWWDGRIVGGWAVGPDGTVRTRLLEDVGSEAATAIDEATASLEPRLEDAVVVPSFRTPLERELSG